MNSNQIKNYRNRMQCTIHTDQCNVEYFKPDLPVVILDYNHLKSKLDLSNSIETAFGRSGLGILFVKNVPELQTKRLRLLQLSRQLAHLPSDIKQSLEDPDSLWSIGYSHGKEMLAKNQPDLRKMSYYGNPLSNDITNGDQELITKYRSVYGPNVWPTDHLPSLQEAFMDLGTMIHGIAQLIAHQLDQYVMRERDGYKPGLFNEAIGTNIPKARLLYYFSDQEMKDLNISAISDSDSESDLKNDADDRVDGWCGWHNDHSALTGLILGMFFDGDGDIITDVKNYKNEQDVDNADNKGRNGGLYIKTRGNVTYQVQLTESESNQYLAFQIGETSQILSGGALIATPHAVMGYKNDKYWDVSRGSFAVFHQPQHDLRMIAPYHDGVTLESVQFDRFLPESVPTLSSRWWNGSDDTFGAFSTRTFETYYDMKMK